MLVSAQGNPGKPCGGYYMQSVAKELMAMNRSRLAGLALTIVTLAVAPAVAHARGGDGALPLKNTTYKAKTTIDSVETTLKVTIKIGGNTHQVAKLVAKLTCAEGKQKLVHKNLAIDEHGYFTKEKRYPSGAPKSQVFGQFVSKHKVDRGSVYGDETKPCGGHTLDFVAKD